MITAVFCSFTCYLTVNLRSYGSLWNSSRHCNITASWRTFSRCYLRIAKLRRGLMGNCGRRDDEIIRMQFLVDVLVRGWNTTLYDEVPFIVNVLLSNDCSPICLNSWIIRLNSASLQKCTLYGSLPERALSIYLWQAELTFTVNYR